MRNQFGYCIRGSHAMLHVSSDINHGTATINHASSVVHEFNNYRVTEIESLKGSLDRFFDIESLGTSCEPKCGNCKCGKCPIGNKMYTIREERELKLIQDGLRYDSEQELWVASYPWIKDPSELPNNVKSAQCKLVSTERRLQQSDKDYRESYQKQIVDMIDRKVARKLTDEELRQYKGPIH